MDWQWWCRNDGSGRNGNGMEWDGRRDHAQLGTECLFAGDHPVKSPPTNGMVTRTIMEWVSSLKVLTGYSKHK